jgi:hypothetical protein
MGEFILTLCTIVFGIITVTVINTTDASLIQKRTDVVIYCNERPAECKKEYSVIKKKQEISNFQPPELRSDKETN